MNNSSIATISFIGGAALGAIITWKVLEKKISDKYEAISQEEIKSVKEKFTIPKVEVKKEESKKEETSTQKIMTKPSLSEYAKKVEKYTNYSNVENNGAHFEPENKTKPYVISPDEFGEDEDYDQQELTLYSDGILADEDDTVLDPNEVVGGKKNLDHIGDYEDDAVHIKNEARKIYYEVLVDERTYEEATGKKKPEVEKDSDLYKRMDNMFKDEEDE